MNTAKVIQFKQPQQQREALPMQKEEGYTRMPNLLIDEQLMAQLSDKAFKCLMFIMRQTVGFDRSSHTIAITQFQKYCGIKKRDTVMACIKDLEELGLIKVERKTGCLNAYFFTPDQYPQKGLVPLKGSTPKGDGTSTTQRDGTSTVKGDGTSPVERGTNKETLKENFKETFKESEHAPENSSEGWSPNKAQLEGILRMSKFGGRISEITSMAGFDFHLSAFNSHFSSKVLSDTQKLHKFAQWILSEFEKEQNRLAYEAKRSGHSKIQATASRDVNTAWEAKRTEQQPMDQIEPVELEDWML